MGFLYIKQEQFYKMPFCRTLLFDGSAAARGIKAKPATRQERFLHVLMWGKQEAGSYFLTWKNMWTSKSVSARPHVFTVWLLTKKAAHACSRTPIEYGPETEAPTFFIPAPRLLAPVHFLLGNSICEVTWPPSSENACELCAIKLLT